MEQQNYINRELSWLEFNQRVLEEVSYSGNPLFERLNFAAIVSSNLDEFFMIRVASVKDQILAGHDRRDPSGLNAEELMEKIMARAHEMVEEQYQKYNYSLKKALKKEKILISKEKDLKPEQWSFVEDYFNKNIFPVLTPMVVDSGRPFPLVLNKSLNIALLVEDKEDPNNIYFATVQVPSVLSRLVEIPSKGDSRTFLLLEDIIKYKLDRIFAGYHILEKACYRITRNADLSIDEEGAEDLLEVILESLRQRKWGAVIRLETEKKVDSRILERLLDELEIGEREVFRIPGPLDLNFLKEIASLKGYESLRYPPFEPMEHIALQNQESLFEAIREKDILLHHPYYSFAPVIEFVKWAAEDPRVLAIKQTLYRVSGNSPIIGALAQAAENGKQVTVMVEIKARFDERNNIQWAKRLETAGCHVIYGFPGLKTHCKVLLVVRREDDGIKRYVHLGTGNYNEITARLYTDLGLFTSNPYFGADASNLFNTISGLSKPMDMNRFVVAPFELRKKMLKLIHREQKNAQQGKEGKIIAKMNSLVDKEIIDALYEASRAGVVIQLIVRGICCLRPGIPGVSENISVISIVGRFLEHSRIYYFYNDGNENIYLSSADMMERNLDRRIEVMFPIDDGTIRNSLKQILDITLSDTEKARKLYADGTYKKVPKRGKEKISSQEIFATLGNTGIDRQE